MPGGCCYFLLLVDDASRYMWAMLLVTKTVAAEKECDHKLLVLCTDNDGEFTAADFTAYYADEGIQRYFSSPYTPQQNGVIKRRNQTMVATACALLKQRGMPAVYWGKAVMTTMHL
jgi:transposase InsO family protein